MVNKNFNCEEVKNSNRIEKIAEKLSTEYPWLEVDYTSEWVKVTDLTLRPELNIYITEEDNELEYHIHIPAYWNGVIDIDNLEDINEFVERVKYYINGIKED